MSILHDLVKKGNDIERLRQLLQRGENPNAVYRAFTPLHEVAFWPRTNPQDIENSVRMAGILIEYGAEINKETEKGYTPLLLAVKYNNHSLVEFLLEKGANVRAVEEYSNTALHFAIRAPNNLSGYPVWDEYFTTRKPVLEMVKTILRFESNLNARNSDNETPVLLAAKYQDFPVLKELLDRAAFADYPDCSKRTPLYYVVNRPSVNLDIVMELLRHCAKFYEPVTFDGLVPMNLFLDWLKVADVAEVERAKSVIRGFFLGKESLRSDHETKIKDVGETKGIELTQFIDRHKMEKNDMEQDKLTDKSSVLDMARRGFFFTTEEIKHQSFNGFDALMHKLKKSEYPLYHEILVRSISRPHLTDAFTAASVNVKIGGRSFLDAYSARYECSYLSHLDLFNCIVAFSKH